MKKNEKAVITVAIIAAFVAGYALGSFLLWPNYNADDTQGSIGKVRKAGQSTESNNKDLDLKLQNDSTYRQEVAYVQSIINIRALQINAAAKAAVEATQDMTEFSEEKQQMKQLEEVSNNAIAAIDKSMDTLEATLKGNSDGSFENTYRNAINAYLTISAQTGFGDAYLMKVEQFLKDKKKDDFQKLALSHDLWLTSNTLQAQLSEDKLKAAAYQKMKDILSLSEKAQALQVGLLQQADRINNLLIKMGQINQLLLLGSNAHTMMATRPNTMIASNANALMRMNALFSITAITNLQNSLGTNNNLFMNLNQLQLVGFI